MHEFSGEISQIYHTIVLFDASKMGHLITPVLNDINPLIQQKNAPSCHQTLQSTSSGQPLWNFSMWMSMTQSAATSMAHAMTMAILAIMAMLCTVGIMTMNIMAMGLAMGTMAMAIMTMATMLCMAVMRMTRGLSMTMPRLSMIMALQCHHTRLGPRKATTLGWPTPPVAGRHSGTGGHRHKSDLRWLEMVQLLLMAPW